MLGLYQLTNIQIESMSEVMRVSVMMIPNEEKRRLINQISLYRIITIHSVLEMMKED